MTIISSTYSIGTLQRDGEFQVIERFADQAGALHTIMYWAREGFDLAAQLAAHSAQLWDNLVAREIERNIDSITSDGSLATITTVYCTLGQLRSALRDAYRATISTNIDRVHLIMIGDFLNTLTDAQLATIFGITQAQAATLRTNKLAPAAALAAQIRAASGY